MGILDIVILVAFFAAMLICTIRGFIRSVSGVVRIVGAYFTAKLLGPILGQQLSLYVIGPKVYMWISERVMEMIGGIDISLNLSALFEEGSGFTDLLTRFGASAQLESLRASYGETTAATAETLTEMAESFAAPWVERVSVMIACAIVFVVAFVILYFVMKLLVVFVDRIRILKRTDRLLGCLLGILTGACAVAVICRVCDFCALTLSVESSSMLLEQIEASVFFKDIYGFVTGAK